MPTMLHVTHLDLLRAASRFRPEMPDDPASFHRRTPLAEARRHRRDRIASVWTQVLGCLT